MACPGFRAVSPSRQCKLRLEHAVILRLSKILQPPNDSTRLVVRPVYVVARGTCALCPVRPSPNVLLSIRKSTSCLSKFRTFYICAPLNFSCAPPPFKPMAAYEGVTHVKFTIRYLHLVTYPITFRNFKSSVGNT